MYASWVQCQKEKQMSNKNARNLQNVTGILTRYPYKCYIKTFLLLIFTLLLSWALLDVTTNVTGKPSGLMNRSNAANFDISFLLSMLTFLLWRFLFVFVWLPFRSSLGSLLLSCSFRMISSLSALFKTSCNRSSWKESGDWDVFLVVIYFRWWPFLTTSCTFLPQPINFHVLFLLLLC